MKKALCIVLLAALFLSVGVSAYADETGETWHVTFTADKKMDSDYTAYNGDRDEITDVLSELQPGDSATFYMELTNQYKDTTDWYMENAILQSLEETQDVASGGAYTYRLTYEGPDGVDVLYDSDSVGGEKDVAADLEGLHEATDSLENYFYLDTLETGEKGYVTLHVALEGETQGNRYQDTVAQLSVNYAVETRDSDKGPTYSTPQTGDEGGVLVWSVIMLGCGLAALVLAIVSTRKESDQDA